MTNVAAATDRDIQLDAGRMHYVDEGAGEPLVFVHGTPSWSFEWRHLIAAFRATHRCLAPDHLGFGLSDRPIDFPYTPEAHARNFAEFVDRLRLPPFTLVVHDFGGPIGLPVCLSHPEQVTRIVLLNTWMWSVAGDRDMERKGRIAGSQLGRGSSEWSAAHGAAHVTPTVGADEQLWRGLGGGRQRGLDQRPVALRQR